MALECRISRVLSGVFSELSKEVVVMIEETLEIQGRRQDFHG